MCIAVMRDNYPLDMSQMLPAHTITVMAPLTLTNLLPHELLFEISPESGRILPGESADLHSVNVEEQLEITVQLDGYPGSGTVNKVPSVLSCFNISLVFKVYSL